MIDQNSQFFAILTAVGEAKQANADALGTPWAITQMGVGDANGTDPIPNRTQTALINERRRAPINELKVDPNNASIIIAEQVIPADIGGWWIREIGLYDAAGDLVAVANCAPSYKPQMSQGSGRTQVVRMNLIVSSAENVQLKIDPSVVVATRTYVDSKDSAHVAAADPHPQYLTAPEGDAKIAAAVAALVNSSPAALDTLAEFATALGNDPNFATTLTNLLALKAPLSSPAFTDSPTAPTPPQFDNDTSLATTEFVQRALGNFANGAVISAAINLAAADCGKAYRCINSGYTIGLPPINSTLYGASVLLKNTGTGSITVARQGADNITFDGTAIASFTLGVGDSALIVMVGGVWSVMGGSAALAYAKTFLDRTKGLAAAQYVTAIPAANAAFTYTRAFSAFVAPCNGIVLAAQSSNVAGGGGQPAAYNNTIQVVGSVAGAAQAGDGTVATMMCQASLQVSKGETVTVTGTITGSATNVTWNAMGLHTSYVFIPTN